MVEINYIWCAKLQKKSNIYKFYGENNARHYLWYINYMRIPISAQF